MNSGNGSEIPVREQPRYNIINENEAPEQIIDLKTNSSLHNVLRKFIDKVV